MCAQTLTALTKKFKMFLKDIYLLFVQDAEGVLRALRLLNAVKIDGQELLLKSNSATQKYLEAYEQHRDQLRRHKQQQKQAQADAGVGHWAWV